jgi:hypothetical protein
LSFRDLIVIRQSEGLLGMDFFRMHEQKYHLSGIFFKRQQEQRRAPSPLQNVGCRTFHPFHAAMGLDHPFDDRQPKTCPFPGKLISAGRVVPDIPDLI